MDLNCIRCQNSIQATDVNLESHIAKCSRCNAVFDFRDQVKVGSTIPRAPVSTPKGIEMVGTMDGLEIIRRWFSAKTVALTFFIVFWDGFLVFWFGMAFTNNQWSMAAFGSIHALVGLGLTYVVLCGYLNKTHIHISFRELSVSHKPLPWMGNKTVPVGDVQQLFSKQKVHRNKNGTSYSYEVHYLDSAGKEQKLLSGLEKSDQALYIEQEIERTLGIKDKAVAGEFGLR